MKKKTPVVPATSTPMWEKLESWAVPILRTSDYDRHPGVLG